MKYSTLLDILETTKDIFESMANVGGDIYLSKVTEITFCLNFPLRASDVKTTQLHILDVFIHNKTTWWKNCGISLVANKVMKICQKTLCTISISLGFSSVAEKLLDRLG